MGSVVVIVLFVFIYNVLPIAKSAPLGFGLLEDLFDNISCDLLNYCDDSEEDDLCTDEPDKSEESTIAPISSTTAVVNPTGTLTDTSTTAATTLSTETEPTTAPPA